MGFEDAVMTRFGQEVVFTNARNLSYSEVACVTVLTWDVLIMISDEVELIWRRAWTPAKMMYPVARYLPWLVQLALLAINVNGSTGLKFTSGQCGEWQVVQGVLLQVIVTTVDAILITRVYALYSRSRLLLSVLGSLFLAELTFLCYVLAVVTPRLTYDDECYVTSSPAIFQYYWYSHIHASATRLLADPGYRIVSLLFETILFALTMYRFGEAVRQGWGKGPILQQFMTDGTWAYALIFLVMLINMMMYKYVHSTLTGICYTWLLVVLSFAGSRLILNPRRAYMAREAPNTENRQESAKSIELTRISGLAPATLSPARVMPGVLHISHADAGSFAGDWTWDDIEKTMH
ncbi:hypothetical protein C2E23DRAFT_572286 [Lenzites betulinus]|nr:hypothetical protein C2E23DRAFT_572286 [Lenzites betulinus]